MCGFSGEDTLIDDQNEHDINSVAGVLKLYFRGLENPLFPKERFLDFISTISEYLITKTAVTQSEQSLTMGGTVLEKGEQHVEAIFTMQNSLR